MVVDDASLEVEVLVLIVAMVVDGNIQPSTGVHSNVHLQRPRRPASVHSAFEYSQHAGSESVSKQVLSRNVQPPAARHVSLST